MSKFWYQLVNVKDNLTVKLSAKESVTFSKRLANVTEHLLDENMHLDNLVKEGRLKKLTDAEKKSFAKSGAKVSAVEAKPAAVKPVAKVGTEPIVAAEPVIAVEPVVNVEPEVVPELHQDSVESDAGEETRKRGRGKK